VFSHLKLCLPITTNSRYVASIVQMLIALPKFQLQSYTATHHPGPPPPHPPSEEVKKSVSSTGDPVKAEIMDDIDKKIAVAGSVLSPNDCLFCPLVLISLESNLTHMSSRHLLFILDAEYLIDITGLITYLGEKIAVSNVCIYCSDKGRDFRTLEAVRKHMINKSALQDCVSV